MLCFLSCRPFVVNATFLTGFVSSGETQHPTRPVENVALTKEGLQEALKWDDDEKIGYKNK